MDLAEPLSDIILYIGYLVGDEGFSQEEINKVIALPFVVRYLVAYDPKAFGFEKVRYNLPDENILKALSRAIVDLQAKGFLLCKENRFFISISGKSFVDSKVKPKYDSTTLDLLKETIVQSKLRSNVVASNETGDVTELPECVQADSMLIQKLRKYPERYDAILEEIIAEKLMPPMVGLKPISSLTKAYYRLAIREIDYLLENELKFGDINLVGKLIFWLSLAYRRRMQVAASRALMSDLLEESKYVDTSLISTESEAKEFLKMSLDILSKSCGLEQTLPLPRVELRENIYYGAIYLLSSNDILLNNKAISLGRVYGELIGIYLRCIVQGYVGNERKFADADMQILDFFAKLGGLTLEGALKDTKYAKLFPIGTEALLKKPVVKVFLNFKQLESFLELRFLTETELMEAMKRTALSH